MYYISKENEIVKELPSYFRNMNEEELAFRGVLPFVDKGRSNAFPIKGEISDCGSEYVQQYVSIETFNRIKDQLRLKLNKLYEGRVDLLVRKSTQDLVFGDISAIPSSVIKMRGALKSEYHQKLTMIKSAKDLAHLKNISL